MSLIWILSSSTSEFAFELAAQAAGFGHEIIHTTSFDEIKLSLRTNDQAQLTSAKVWITNDGELSRIHPEIIVNLVNDESFWETQTVFETEEKRSALWGLLSFLDCQIINRPSKHGFFPWVDILELTSKLGCRSEQIFSDNLKNVTECHEQNQTLYLVKGKLICNHDFDIKYDNRDFWIGLLRQLDERQISLSQIVVREENSSVLLISVTSYLSKPPSAIADIVYREVINL